MTQPTRRQLYDFAEVSTWPHNTGASATACRIVRSLIQLDGMLPVVAEDFAAHHGFIAHLCRATQQELESIERDQQAHALQAKQDAQLRNHMDCQLTANYANGDAYDSTEY